MGSKTVLIVVHPFNKPTIFIAMRKKIKKFFKKNLPIILLMMQGTLLFNTADPYSIISYPQKTKEAPIKQPPTGYTPIPIFFYFQKSKGAKKVKKGKKRKRVVKIKSKDK